MSKTQNDIIAAAQANGWRVHQTQAFGIPHVRADRDDVFLTVFFTGRGISWASVSFFNDAAFPPKVFDNGHGPTSIANVNVKRQVLVALAL